MTALLTNGPVEIEIAQGGPPNNVEETSVRHSSSRLAVGVEDDDELSPEEGGNSSADSDVTFLAQCRLAIALGLAAHKYGASGSNVEGFLTRIMSRRCSLTGDAQSVVFRISNTEMFCSITRSGSEWPITIIADLQEGFNLNKLSKLSGVLQAVENEECSFQDSIERLEQIVAEPDPYGFWLTGFSWTIVGFGLPPLLGGTWWDALVGLVMAGITYVVSTAFAKYLPNRLQNPWNNVAISFVAGVLSTAIKIAKPELNIVLTVLGAIAIPLPGFAIFLGIAQLAVGRIIPGMSHLIGGLMTLAWLLFGAYAGSFVVDRAANVPSETHGSSSVPGYWQALFVPLLCIALTIAFQTAYRDFLWSILCQGLAYGILAGFSFLPEGDSANTVGIVVSSIVMTLCSNGWSRFINKPSQILLTPAIVLQVSGSIGFRGIVSLGQGDTEKGTQELLQMCYVAILIFLGVFVGVSILPSTSSI